MDVLPESALQVAPACGLEVVPEPTTSPTSSQTRETHGYDGKQDKRIWIIAGIVIAILVITAIATILGLALSPPKVKELEPGNRRSGSPPSSPTSKLSDFAERSPLAVTTWGVGKESMTTVIYQDEEG
ncbi:hypothetical protein K469DRAFT_684230 [Zopfia rhizophila CBS 207.26]|uniref:Uncharacterized protein n=1 Tax=Zopfia rhizophila CBS 207.26 TaxID=1314779 RepID=A0A6A6EAS3_9PEZI|nr:hypothetical protein K469DRAFT_684230 [Zopfia rhizophila CBS 207.26]